MSIFAQQSLDTIYANDKKNVALFFPTPIRQGITGASNFVFTYNREKEQYFGLIQAKPGIESNLLTITSDGKVYSYILKYSEEPPKLNYFFTKNESIGNESPTKKVPKTENGRTTYFERASEYLLKSRPETIATERKGGIRLRLQEIVYNANEVYLIIEIRNISGIDFEIDYLNVYRTNGNKKRKASYQRLEQEVVYKHKMQYSIRVGQSQRFVYVLPKFVLGDNEKLMLELKELKGSRKVVMETRL
ncbi:DUF4138 domain-containing protein [Maribacter polysiphoniae]|uniref:DUF4138 domain-containing protein n=1 Tax=Maribacter polysiphoniae TaxID=429344 RepID=UPI0023568B79|nr:DUF4138 domain-containing protein [Maribacter polysiphoniae]